MFGEEFWEERYRSHEAVWSRNANPQLVTEASDLVPGTALDVGSGEGTDSLWLATRGWQVTAVDFSTTALQRGAAHAEAIGPEVAERIRWVRADLANWAPAESFDLVSAQFMHLPPVPRQELFTRLASMVAPGGTLLIVGHHPSDLQTAAHRPPAPDLFYTAEEPAASLEPGGWDVLVSEARPRTAISEGEKIGIHDTVLRARKHA
ncbi:MAG: class I SAM-dependent methyltransferase [Geodermatophilaceae bacterium]|nr:class I SAM-dependent methyltransferase [Geodermatophilaceae bacterium]